MLTKCHPIRLAHFEGDAANAYDYKSYSYNAIFEVGTLSKTNPDEYTFTSSIAGQSTYALGYNETNFSGGPPIPRRQEVEGFAGGRGRYSAPLYLIRDMRILVQMPDSLPKDTGVPDNNNWENILFNFTHSAGNPTAGTVVTIPAEDFRYNGPMGSARLTQDVAAATSVVGVFEAGQMAFKLKSEGLVTEALMFDIDADVPKAVIYPTVPAMRSIDHTSDALLPVRTFPTILAHTFGRTLDCRSQQVP
jgi:hypothetical protein